MIHWDVTQIQLSERTILFILIQESININIILTPRDMEGFPTLMKLATEDFYEELDDSQVRMGKMILDNAVFEAAHFELKNPKEYLKIQNTIQILIQDKLDLDTAPNYLYMCVGKCAKQGNIEKLRQIQQEVAQMMGANKKKQNQQANLNNTNTTKPSESFVISESNFQSPKIQMSSVSNAYAGKSSTSGDKKDESVLSLSNSSFSDVLSLLNEEEDSGVGLLKVENYLAGLQSYNSEMNFLCQKLKFQDSNVDYQALAGNMALVRRKVAINNSLMKKVDEIVKQATGKNKKDATEKANLQLLRVIYQKYPRVLDYIQQQKLK